MTGIPSSGKTKTALKLKTFLEETKGCKVHLISENEIVKSEGDKNDVLSDSRKEKTIRGALKSESIRHLTKDSVVICDGLNYIKGTDTKVMISDKVKAKRKGNSVYIVQSHTSPGSQFHKLR